jgi:hypothetical protein
MSLLITPLNIAHITNATVSVLQNAIDNIIKVILSIECMKAYIVRN